MQPAPDVRDHFQVILTSWPTSGDLHDVRITWKGFLTSGAWMWRDSDVIHVIRSWSWRQTTFPGDSDVIHIFTTGSWRQDHLEMAMPFHSVQAWIFCTLRGAFFLLMVKYESMITPVRDWHSSPLYQIGLKDYILKVLAPYGNILKIKDNSLITQPPRLFFLIHEISISWKTKSFTISQGVKFSADPRNSADFRRILVTLKFSANLGRNLKVSRSGGG